MQLRRATTARHGTLNQRRHKQTQISTRVRDRKQRSPQQAKHDLHEFESEQIIKRDNGKRLTGEESSDRKQQNTQSCEIGEIKVNVCEDNEEMMWNGKYTMMILLFPFS